MPPRSRRRTRRPIKAAFPQHPDQAPGCGFALPRLAGWFCLASGALLGGAAGDYWHWEMALAAWLWELLAPGEGLLADPYYGCYRVLALVRARGADAVCRLHGSRAADFRRGQRLGPMDRQITWTRPRQLPAGLNLQQWLAFPATLTVRLVRVRVEEKGFRTRTVTLVTTLLDPQKYPVSARAALYRRRWQVELGFRQIKDGAGDGTPGGAQPGDDRPFTGDAPAGLPVDPGLDARGGTELGRAAGTDELPGRGGCGAAFWRGALADPGTKGQRSGLRAELRRILAADAVPERPGRREPRALKRRPKGYRRPDCPRRQYREQPQRNRRAHDRAHTRKKSNA